MSSKQHEHREQAEKPKSGTGTHAPLPSEAAEKPAAPPPEAGSGEELKSLKERCAGFEAKVAALTEENSSLKDQYLRKLADYENFRKRMFREKEEGAKYATSALLGDLVPVLDDFDRAIASSEQARDFQILHDGIALIRRQMGGLLESKYGLQRFESLGKPFDPNIHEALSTEPGGESEPTVAEEYLPGYRLHDRIVRSAKVRVRMPSPGAARPAEQNASHSARGNEGAARPAEQNASHSARGNEGAARPAEQDASPSARGNEAAAAEPGPGADHEGSPGAEAAGPGAALD